MSEGLQAERVTQILAETEEGHFRGSGYLISQNLVLTSGHVIAGAKSINVVVFSPEHREEVIPALSWLLSDEDVPHFGLVILPHVNVSNDENPPFGRLKRRAAVLTAETLGFPLYKLRPIAGNDSNDETGSSRVLVRDSLHVPQGKIALLSNLRNGTLALSTGEEPTWSEGADNPWEGMSGAPVFIAEHIIGLIDCRYPGESPGTLTVRPIEDLKSMPSHNLEFSTMLGLPADLDSLPDMTQGSSRTSAVLAAYARDVRAIAPETLFGRSSELADLVSFIASHEQYLWWQAGPWAGKTAFSATIAFDPPGGVEVASFFITARLPSQSNSAAFLLAMIDQLAGIADEARVTLDSRPGQRGRYFALIEAAGKAAAARRHRLLLVVDGLDEDQGTGQESIASLIPEVLPDNVKVLVTSRANPGLPQDVGAKHPLRDCLSPSWPESEYAAEVRDRADAELGRILKYAEPTEIAILQAVTVSGGGLSVHDICAITKMPRWVIRDCLTQSFARCLRSRSPVHSPATGPVFLFAHDKLREAAEEALSDDLEDVRCNLISWADGYRDDRWPMDTPEYLLRSYPRVLGTHLRKNDTVSIVIDLARHERIVSRTGSGLLSMSELAEAARLLKSDHSTESVAAQLAAVGMEDFVRQSDIPDMLVDVIKVHALLGEFGPAEGRVYYLGTMLERLDGMLAIAEAAAENSVVWARELARDASTLMHTVPDGTTRNLLLHRFAVLHARLGEVELAKRRILELSSPELRARCAVECAAGSHRLPSDTVADLKSEILSELSARSSVELGAASLDAFGVDFIKAAGVEVATLGRRIVQSLPHPQAVMALSRATPVFVANGKASIIEEGVSILGTSRAAASAAIGLTAAYWAAGDQEQGLKWRRDAEALLRKESSVVPRFRLLGELSVVDATWPAFSADVSQGLRRHILWLQDRLGEDRPDVSAMLALAETEGTTFRDHASELVSRAESILRKRNRSPHVSRAHAALLTAFLSNGDTAQGVRAAWAAPVNDRDRLLERVFRWSVDHDDLDSALRALPRMSSGVRIVEVLAPALESLLDQRKWSFVLSLLAEVQRINLPLEDTLVIELFNNAIADDRTDVATAAVALRAQRAAEFTDLLFIADMVTVRGHREDVLAIGSRLRELTRHGHGGVGGLEGLIRFAAQSKQQFLLRGPDDPALESLVTSMFEVALPLVPGKDGTQRGDHLGGLLNKIAGDFPGLDLSEELNVAASRIGWNPRLPGSLWAPGQPRLAGALPGDEVQRIGAAPQRAGGGIAPPRPPLYDPEVGDHIEDQGTATAQALEISRERPELLSRVLLVLEGQAIDWNLGGS
ncbi:hypothetical protein [Ornithinimicrobium cerasi]|uniref:hypothetical protein n=1 Tax=Ornithinimicrobium cerasi TaxID=2248773 RepID=UPI00137A192B|nr:hypothetical protein [Ornithinimicrobium cerasi]